MQLVADPVKSISVSPKAKEIIITALLDMIVDDGQYLSSISPHDIGMETVREVFHFFSQYHKYVADYLSVLSVNGIIPNRQRISLIFNRNPLLEMTEQLRYIEEISVN